MSSHSSLSEPQATTKNSECRPTVKERARHTIQWELNETGQFFGLDSELEDIAEAIVSERGGDFFSTLDQVKDACAELLEEAGEELEHVGYTDEF